MTAVHTHQTSEEVHTGENRPELPQSGRDAARALFELAPLQKRHIEEKTAAMGMSAPLAGLLWRLQPDKPTAMGAIAEFMHCDASNVTSMVDKLEAKGMVQRQPSPEDRRVKLIVLTEQGRSFREQLFSKICEPTEWILALDEADRVELARILRKAKERMTRQG